MKLGISCYHLVYGLMICNILVHTKANEPIIGLAFNIICISDEQNEMH
jgi:hypothetical protein